MRQVLVYLFATIDSCNGCIIAHAHCIQKTLAQNRNNRRQRLP